MADETADNCPYCGLTLNDGGADWVLQRMDARANAGDVLMELAQAQRSAGIANPFAMAPTASPAGAAAAAGTPDALTPTSVAAMLAWLAEVVVADGQVTAEELNIFRTMCDRQRMTARQTKAILDAAIGGHKGASQPANRVEARRWLENLAAGIAERGTLPDEDLKLLNGAATKLGFSDWDAQAIAKHLRTQALTQARRALAMRNNAGGPPNN
jgi:hypothetical protein